MTVRTPSHGSQRKSSRHDAPDRRTATRGGRGAMALLAVVLLLGSAHALFLLGVESYRAFQAVRAIEKLERDVAELEAEAELLRQVVIHGADESYREQLARRQGFIYPDEVRVVTLPE